MTEKDNTYTKKTEPEKEETVNTMASAFREGVEKGIEKQRIRQVFINIKENVMNARRQNENLIRVLSQDRDYKNSYTYLVKSLGRLHETEEILCKINHI